MKYSIVAIIACKKIYVSNSLFCGIINRWKQQKQLNDVGRDIAIEIMRTLYRQHIPAAKTYKEPPTHPNTFEDMSDRKEGKIRTSFF
jgi:hypothetical protein